MKSFCLFFSSSNGKTAISNSQKKNKFQLNSHQKHTTLAITNKLFRFFFLNFPYAIQIISNQSRSCTAWNVSLHEFSPVDDENLHCGPILHQFCPRDKHKQFALPWNLKTLVIKAQAMTRTAPLYTLKWKSSVARQKIQNPTPAPNVVSKSEANLLSLLLLVITLIFHCSTLGR